MLQAFFDVFNEWLMMWNVNESKSKVELSETNCDSDTEAESFKNGRRNESAIFVNVKEINDLKYNSTCNSSLG